MTATDTTPRNRYLEGNFAPVIDELSVEELPVTGSIPLGLEGMLVRNGPNPITADPAVYHWFTGNGMLHAIELGDGRALSYRNRWVRTDPTAEALGEEPIPGQPADTALGFGNVANTNVVTHGGRLLALVEVCLPTEVRTDLSTVGRYDFGGGLRTAMTAHPKTDPVTGELHFFGYDMFGPPFLRYHVADAAGSLVRTEAITVPGSTMVHDFAITRSRVMFMDLPVVFDMDLVGKRGMPYRWDADYGARVGVMPRDGGDADIIWCEIEPCYVFHVLNAYDDGDEIVADVCRYDHMFAGDVHGIAGADPRLVRWHIDPAARKVREEEVLGLPSEFPRVDDRLAGSRHRYGYMTSINAATDVALHGLRKVDLLTGATTEHDFGSGRSSGEGVFVPAGDGSGEDEGFVLSVVHDAATDGSELVILDASDFSAPPVATVRLPQRVPFGFHGNWVPSGSVTA